MKDFEIIPIEVRGRGEASFAPPGNPVVTDDFSAWMVELFVLMDEAVEELDDGALTGGPTGASENRR